MNAKLTHPADGIYATSEERLIELNACICGRVAFIVAAKHVTGNWELTPQDSVLISWDLLTKINELEPCLRWLLGEMCARELITHPEFWDALGSHKSGYHRFGHSGAAEAVMDLLLVRAKREGLVP